MTHNRATLLLVDDTPENIDVLVGILEENYNLKVALDGKTALKIIDNEQPDLILLDIMMPGMDGFEVCKKLKSHPTTASIPIIFVTAMGDVEDEAAGLNIGAVDYITKPVNAAVVRARVATHVALHNQSVHLEQLVCQRTLEVELTRRHVIECLGRAAEYKDNATGRHVIRMSRYAELLAKSIGLSKPFCKQILHAAPMHDIGKIGIPDNILKKPGRLDSHEWNIMQTHSELGSRILGEMNSDLMKMASTIALTHHERWDGQGYPHRLCEEDIPIEGRIVAIADVFDALISPRPYKSPWSIDDTFDLLATEKGKHFDPLMVDSFMLLRPELERVHNRYGDH